MSIGAALVAFFAGLFLEGCGTLWVHHAQRGRPSHVGALSLLVATCQVTGIGHSLAHWTAGAAYVAGYGLGGYLGVVVTRRLKRAP